MEAQRVDLHRRHASGARRDKGEAERHHAGADHDHHQADRLGVVLRPAVAGEHGRQRPGQHARQEANCGQRRRRDGENNGDGSRGKRVATAGTITQHTTRLHPLTLS